MILEFNMKRGKNAEGMTGLCHPAYRQAGISWFKNNWFAIIINISTLGVSKSNS